MRRKDKKLIGACGEATKPKDLLLSEIESNPEYARALDSLLDLYSVREADDGLINKIVVENTATRSNPSGFLSFLFNPSFALAAVVLFLLFGFMAGFYDGFTEEALSQQIDPATALLGPVEDIGVI
ncbi:MAG: hypothetical protein ACT4NX_05675 [Deltaproteobacteria bacterium]